LQAIAQAHGGWVELFSRLGHGSTLTIVIPVTLQDVATHEQDSLSKTSRITAFLETVAGARVHDHSRWARSGLYGSGQRELTYLLDLGLPDSDGLEVLAAVRGQGETLSIILTARDGVDDTVAGLEGGADITLPL